MFYYFIIGLVDGGKYIRKMDWKSVRGWLAIVSDDIIFLFFLDLLYFIFFKEGK